MKKILYIFFIFLCSCGIKNEPLDLFSEVETLADYEVLDIEQYEILDVDGFHINREYYAITHYKDSTMLTLVNTRTNKFLKGCPKGRGPNEFLSAEILSIQNGVLFINDANSEKVYEIDIEKCFDSNNITYTVVENPYPLVRGYISNKYIVGKPMIESDSVARFVLYNRLNKKLDLYYQFPKWMDNFDNFRKFTADFQTRISLHPENIGFVTSDIQGGFLSIWRIVDDKIVLHKDFIFHLPKIFFSKNNMAISEKDNKMGFSRTSVSKKYIFGSYIGATSDESKKNHSGTEHLLVFDWDGNPVKRYILPLKMNIRCYNEKENAIYGLNYEGETKVVKYKLN